MKELEHFPVEGKYGWDQEDFTEWWMNRGGCAAVTACDACIVMARNLGLTGLYPFDPERITREDYLAFADRMKQTLFPRPKGVNTTALYMDGLREYLDTRPGPVPKMRGVQGSVPFEAAAAEIRGAIDRGFPVPYLMLRHTDQSLDDFIWHWFLLNGYDDAPGAFMVKAVSYGEWVWMDLGHLWDTGFDEKGGFVVFSLDGPPSVS